MYIYIGVVFYTCTTNLVPSLPAIEYWLSKLAVSVFYLKMQYREYEII